MAAGPKSLGSADDQAAVIAFLSDPASHPGADTVTRIDTHAAIVFLAGNDAYKLKRAVRYPFLDFSTLEKRRTTCLHEIEVNQANAPQIYLGVVPVTRDADGDLAIDGDGTPVDWLVHMVRFDHTRTLDRIADQGPLATDLIDALAHELVRAHERAPRRDPAPWIADLRHYVDQNAVAFDEHAAVFDRGQARRLIDSSIAEYDCIRPLLEARGAAGYIRLCHGDAHLGNIVLIAGQPVLFDAIEFDDVIATSDLLYDLAFLLMDLWERGHAFEANRTLNRYLVESRRDDHYDGLAALPFFLMMRAAIRAKVTAAGRLYRDEAEASRMAVEARAYFDAAQAFLEPTSPRLVAVGGLSGSGKSTAAADIAAEIGRAPGAVVVRSDVLRKQLFGVAETEHLPPHGYGPEVTEAVYEKLYATIARILKTGHSAIADAVFSLPQERDAIEAVARSIGVPFDGLWLEAPEAVLARRVTVREGDASDADAQVVHNQTSADVGPISWHIIDASGTPAQSADRARAAVRSRPAAGDAEG